MKARIKHTNQIINVERDPLGWSWESPKGNVLLDTEELIFLDDDFDWQSLRAEAAKDILCAMIQGGYGEGRINTQSALAVKYVDKLINHLKEK